jgi:hypothetical protein
MIKLRMPRRRVPPPTVDEPIAARVTAEVAPYAAEVPRLRLELAELRQVVLVADVPRFAREWQTTNLLEGMYYR